MDTKGALCLPVTKTGRKYGYITWRKKYDDKVQEFFGLKPSFKLVYGNIEQKNKHIDWKHRRVGITYTLTRSIPSTATIIKLSKLCGKKIKIDFK